MKTQFVAVRHGQTDYNLRDALQGQIDIPLNARGIEQAKQAAAALRGESFDAVYCSHLSRARQTAEIICELNGYPEPAIVPDLQERNFGAFEGLLRDELETLHPEFHKAYLLRDPHCRFGSGESLLDLEARARRAYAELAMARPAAKALTVSHGAVMQTLRRICLGLPAEAILPGAIGNCEIHRFEIEAGQFRNITFSAQ